MNLIEEHIEGFSLYFEEYLEFFTDKNIEIKDITYVETKLYPDSFLRPLFLYISEYVKNLKGKKIFVFDECWHVLENNIHYLGEFFRTSRSQGISCIAISQLFDDLLSSSIGKVIAKNTYFKLIFSSPEKQNEYLNSYDLTCIKNLKSKRGFYADVYLKTNEKSKTLRYYPSALEHELFTTHAQEKKAIEAFIQDHQKYFNHKSIIERWTKLKYDQNNNSFFDND